MRSAKAGEWIRVISQDKPEFYNKIGQIQAVVGKRLDTCYIQIGDRCPTFFISELEPATLTAAKEVANG